MGLRRRPRLTFRVPGLIPIHWKLHKLCSPYLKTLSANLLQLAGAGQGSCSLGDLCGSTRTVTFGAVHPLYFPWLWPQKPNRNLALQLPLQLQDNLGIILPFWFPKFLLSARQQFKEERKTKTKYFFPNFIPVASCLSFPFFPLLLGLLTLTESPRITTWNKSMP